MPHSFLLPVEAWTHTAFKALLISALMIAALSVEVSAGESSLTCTQLAHAFLVNPTNRTHAKLMKAEATGCKAEIVPSNAKLNLLIQSVRKGNRWAAQYLAGHLSSTDGGNLEDALIGLGRFGDRHMDFFLMLLKNDQITDHAFVASLTMFSGSLADRLQAQLAFLKSRRTKISGVTNPELSKQREYALKSVDGAIFEVERNLPK